MSSANSYLSSTAYHASNARYARSSSPSTNNRSTGPTTSSFNIQQPLNDLNSTRSSNSTCSTSHCLSHQCLECTTILSTRPFHPRCHLNSYIDPSSNGSHFPPTNGYLVSSTLDHHSTLPNTDDLSVATRVLSMNIPVDNSNLQSHPYPLQTSPLNIEIEEEEDDAERDEGQIEIPSHDDGLENHSQSQRYELFDEYPEETEQLEVFVGFYRPGEYQRENDDEDEDQSDEDLSEPSQRMDSQKKEEQSMREMISDQDEGNEDQDFIDEDLGPNQDEENDAAAPAPSQTQTVPVEDLPHPLEHGIFLNANILEQEEEAEGEDPMPIAMALIQIDEDEDQGFGAQFNDDCPSSDDENNHVSTVSLNDQIDHHHDDEDDDQTLICAKKRRCQRSQSDSQLHRRDYTIFLSLPSLSVQSSNSFEKVEHIIIDDQQPATTMSNCMIKKKNEDETDYLSSQKKKILRRSSEEILEISNDEGSLTFTVEDAVRDMERHVMLWSDDQARQMERHSSIEQVMQYFQLNADHHLEHPLPTVSMRNKDSLLEYLHYRSVIDTSASDLHATLLQYPDFSSRVHSRFFPFWPPRDVDLLQWLTHWLKQNALPIAVMNMDHHSSRTASNHSMHSSWQHRIIYGIEPRGIYLMNPLQIQTPQQLYEQLTVDSISSIPRQEIVQRYNEHPMPLTALATGSHPSKFFSDRSWRKMNVLGQVVNVLREERQLEENETRNLPYRPTVTHVRIPSTCSSGILIFSKDINLLINANELPLRQ